MPKPPLISVLALILLSGSSVPAETAPPAEPVAAAPAADNPPSDFAKQLADVQDKLSTALHSYQILQDENNQLKAATEAAAADKAAQAAQLETAQSTIESLKSQAAVATQVAALRDQLRQSENEVASLAEENARLKTQLALSGPAPGAAALAPTRPGADSSFGPAPGERSLGSISGVTELPSTPAPAMPAAAGKDSAKIASVAPAAGSPAPADAGPRIYVVVAGDTLGKISRQFYGSANHYDKIVAANRDVIHDENNLQVGMKLKIP